MVMTPAMGSEGPRLNPDSNFLCSCHCSSSNSDIQAHEIYFNCLPTRLSDETLNRGPESVTSVVPAC